jgi:undecaprenyl-diphosphatase
MTLLLVMLHTGTMFAVIVYFWSSWKTTFFASRKVLWDSVKWIAAATVMTALVGLSLKVLIERFMLKDASHAEVELLFGNLTIISIALAAVGIVILFSGWRSRRSPEERGVFGLKTSCLIGAVQGVCLPFRGFSRSGATISTGLLLGIPKKKVEDFSFALAVVLTPPVILREILRFLKAPQTASLDMPGRLHLFYSGLLGMSLSFVFGILALRWLSSWLERGRWHLFGVYCLCAAAGVYFFMVRS